MTEDSYKLLYATPEMVQSFCEAAGDSLKTFRYFTSRPFATIANHLVTYIITQNDNKMAYGHLDPEGDNVWLGICVAEDYLRQGYGEKMMQHLLSYANRNEVPSIILAVDKSNLSAIKFYNKFGFTQQNCSKEVIFMKREVSDG